MHTFKWYSVLADKLISYEVVVQHREANQRQLRQVDLELKTLVKDRIVTCKIQTNHLSVNLNIAKIQNKQGQNVVLNIAFRTVQTKNGIKTGLQDNFLSGGSRFSNPDAPEKFYAKL